jgi:anaphase-promoting complex subunit 8
MDTVSGRVPAHDLNAPSARTALRIACRDLQDRGLYIAARWAAELLNSIPPAEAGPFATSTPTKGLPRQPDFAANMTFSSPGVDPSYCFLPPPQQAPIHAGVSALLHDDDDELDVYHLGKAYFDAKELERAAHVLQDCKGARGRFLGLYARFLVCALPCACPLSRDSPAQAAEKRVQEDADVMMGADALFPQTDQFNVAYRSKGQAQTVQPGTDPRARCDRQYHRRL